MNNSYLQRDSKQESDGDNTYQSTFKVSKTSKIEYLIENKKFDEYILRKRIKSFREDKNIGIRELASKLRKSHSYINNIEKYAIEFGISGKTGLELSEASGTVYDLEKIAKVDASK